MSNAVLVSLAISLEACRDDPNVFNEAFLARPSYWTRQREMCRSVVDYRTTAVYSGNMVGKDYWIAGVIIWWLLTRPDSLCISTGPSQTLLGSVTFKEIRRCLDVAVLPFGGKVSTGIKASPAVIEIKPGWQALGFSTTSVERSSGQHAKHLLTVVEEASGVDDFCWEAIDSLGYERLVVIGNPLRSQGRFVDLIHQAARDRADNVPPRLAVNAIRIPSTESPHANLEKSEYGLADRTWLESMYRKYGRRSLWVACHIDARIPDLDAAQLIEPRWLEYHVSQKRPTVAAGHPVEMTRAIACDLSEGVGRDSTCVVVVDAWGVLDLELGAGLGLPEAAESIARLARKWRVPHARISFDKLGIGRGFPNHLARHGIKEAIPYAGEGHPQDRTTFTNLRTEAGWKLRDRLDPTRLDHGRTAAPFFFGGNVDLYWTRLVDELAPLTYGLVGKMTKLLPKDEWATILGHSPDVADALIQSQIHASLTVPRPPTRDLPMGPNVTHGDMIISIPEGVV